MRTLVVIAALFALGAPAHAGPRICPAICKPVCGADGKDYCNGCLAARAGTTVGHDGACAAATPCESTPPSGQKCPRIYRPVCGCDGKTYSNVCVATAAGISSTTGGACKTKKRRHHKRH